MRAALLITKRAGRIRTSMGGTERPRGALAPGRFACLGSGPAGRPGARAPPCQTARRVLLSVVSVEGLGRPMRTTASPTHAKNEKSAREVELLPGRTMTDPNTPLRILGAQDPPRGRAAPLLLVQQPEIPSLAASTHSKETRRILDAPTRSSRRVCAGPRCLDTSTPEKTRDTPIIPRIIRVTQSGGRMTSASTRERRLLRSPSRPPVSTLIREALSVPAAAPSSPLPQPRRRGPAPPNCSVRRHRPFLPF